MLKSTSWAHLPNAALIDWVLADAAARPAAWRAAYEPFAESIPHELTGFCALVAAKQAGRESILHAARSGAVGRAASDAVAALVVWDESGVAFGLTADALRALGQSPLAAPYERLLLPAAIAKETQC